MLHILTVLPLSDATKGPSDGMPHELGQKLEIFPQEEYDETSQESFHQNQMGDKVAYVAYSDMFEGEIKCLIHK